MEHSLDEVTKLIRQIAKRPQHVYARQEAHSQFTVYVHSADLQHVKANQNEIELVLDQKLKRPINIRVFVGRPPNVPQFTD